MTAAKKSVRDSDLYFIRRGGAWFRPEARGYTGDLSAAGAFVGAKAKAFLSAEGVELVAVRDMLPALRKQMGEHIAAANTMFQLIQQF